MKTKYIKVPVSERLPNKQGHYLLKKHHIPDVTLYYFLDDLHDGEYLIKNVEYWLEAVPDREEEMREMIAELVSDNTWENPSWRKKIKARKLLNELKQTS